MNTRDLIGDKKTVCKFIDASIDSFEDDAVFSYIENNCYRSIKFSNVNLPNARYFRGPYAFDNCDTMTSINLPSLAANIPNYTFRSCKALTNVLFPLVTDLDRDAFDTCNALSIAEFPKLSYISNYVFTGCRSLTKLIIRNTASVAGLSSVNAFNNTNTAWLIYVPDSLVEDYKTATNWSTYAGRIKPLSELLEEEES